MFVYEPVDRAPVEQIQLRHGDERVAGAGADVVGDPLGRCEIAGRDDGAGAGGGQCAGGLYADAAGGAGDQRLVVVQVDAGDDVRSGGGEGER